MLYTLEAVRENLRNRQGKRVFYLAKEGFLNEEELDMYRRGRNSKSHTIAKNADVTTYRIATGFESLMGYLHLSGQKERLEELIGWCIQEVEENNYEK